MNDRIDGLTPGETAIVGALCNARAEDGAVPVAASEICQRLGMARLSIKVMIRSIRTKRPDIDIRSSIGPYGGYWLSDEGLCAAGRAA